MNNLPGVIRVEEDKCFRCGELFDRIGPPDPGRSDQAQPG